MAKKETNKRIENLDDSKEKVREQIENISASYNAALVECAKYRKIIVGLLELTINALEKEMFNKEYYLQNLFFPMQKISGGIEYNSHNLWLIDERFSCCDYMASDIPLKSSHEKEDILMMDRPIAFSDASNQSAVYEIINIVELEPPARNDYHDDANPIRQMLKYVDKLSSNQTKDRYGRIIHTNINTRYHLYGICDITPSLQSILDMGDFRETADGKGRYKYHERMHAHIEVIPYEKMISDAKRRNQVLSDKLGI